MAGVAGELIGAFESTLLLELLSEVTPVLMVLLALTFLEL